MKNNYIYIIVFMLVGLISCKEEATTRVVIDADNGMEVDILHSAGDKWAASDHFLPLPFNVAQGGTDEIIVLSERIKSGVKLDVKPIGAIRLLQNDTLITYVVSIPVDREKKSIKADDFDEFSTVYSGAKWIIEQYLINRQNSHGTKLKSWENENYAIKYLLK